MRHGPQADVQDTGRRGYREPSDPPDDRPVIVHAPFWSSESERLTYEHAVESWPRRQGEGAMTYIARIAAKVEGRLAAAAKSFPPPERLSPVEFYERQVELQAQREADQEGSAQPQEREPA